MKRRESMTAADRAYNARHDNGNQRKWLLAIACTPKPLTLWESGFLSDLADAVHSDHDLTDAQAEKLEQIYAERTS